MSKRAQPVGSPGTLGEYVCRMPVTDDKTGLMIPPGNVVQIEHNRAKLLLNDGTICHPKDFDGEIRNLPKRNPQKNAGLKTIETDKDAEAQVKAVSEARGFKKAPSKKAPAKKASNRGKKVT